MTVVAGGKLPVESASMDVVVSVFKTLELTGEKWIEEIARVLKPGGAVVMQGSFEQSGSMVIIL